MTAAASEALSYISDDEATIRSALGGLLHSTGFPGQLFEKHAGGSGQKAPQFPICFVLGVQLQADRDQSSVRILVRGIKTNSIDCLENAFGDDHVVGTMSVALIDRQPFADHAKERLRRLHDSLSPREREVMALVAAGLMNKQIAARLVLSEITVKIHRGNVMRKMGAQSLADLVRQAEVLDVRDKTAARFNKAGEG